MHYADAVIDAGARTSIGRAHCDPLVDVDDAAVHTGVVGSDGVAEPAARTVHIGDRVVDGGEHDARAASGMGSALVLEPL